MVQRRRLILLELVQRETKGGMSLGDSVRTGIAELQYIVQNSRHAYMSRGKVMRQSD
jgi:hypothetical protein